jgi:signal transduction histidine kinase/CheY-like chemotaxis protein
MNNSFESGSAQRKFERLLFDLSTQFVVVRLNAEELAAAIRDALGHVNCWLEVHGSAMGRIDLESGTFSVLHANPDSAILDALPLHHPACEHIATGDDLLVTLPSEDALGQSLREQGLEGLLILPLSAEDNRITYLACWWRQRHPLDSIERAQLRMIGELTLAALQRHDAETRQAQLEEKLRQGRKLQSLGLLAGGVAHDFNNLLTVIRGCAEVAIRGQTTKRPIEEYLAQIISASDQAAAMARKLLAFGRQGVTVGNSVAVNEVVQELRPLLSRLLRGNIELKLELTDEPCVVATSATDIEQIVMNLCVNSGEAMPHGGDLRICTRRVSRPPPTETHSRTYVELCVRDAGSGIHPQQVSTIFDPFFTTKAFGEGAGLGLSVVHGIVTQLEGFVEVDTTPGVGTEMRIYLPSVTAEPDHAPVSAVAFAPRSSATILIVDDFPGVCLVMSATLEAAGYKTLCANGADEAFDLFEKHGSEISLTVLDLIMPKVGGREVYDRLSLARPGLPVLFVSGYTANTLPKAYLERPEAELLPKPFTGDQLLGGVRRLLAVQATAKAVAASTR